jgi:hypothetical protein
MKKTMLILLAVLAATALYATQIKVDYWVASAYGGMAYPVMTMGNDVNGGFDMGISVRKGLDSETQVGGGLSYVQMPYKLSNAPGPFKATVLDVEGVYAPYVPDFVIWPYVKVMVGLYMMDYSRLDSAQDPVVASEDGFGFAGGIGANYPITNQFSATLEILYNQVSLAGGTGDQYTYITFNAGITAFFK